MLMGRLSVWILTNAMYLMRDRRAVTALEYALLTGLIAILIAGAISLFSTNAKTVFTTVANTL